MKVMYERRARACLVIAALSSLLFLWVFQVYDGDVSRNLSAHPLSFIPGSYERKQYQHSVMLSNETPVNKILLMTYMRSGSSFVGELLRFGGNVFYVFEPFWSVYEKTFRTDTEICHRNGTCVRPTKTLQKMNKTMDIINAIFDCRISELPREVLKSFTNFHFTSGYSRRCRSILTKRQMWKSRRKGVKLYDNKKEWCLTRWEKACQRASVRVIKTIRLSPRILKTSNMSGVKVVHLTRHPLGILNSRMKIGEVNNTNMVSHAKTLCQMMTQDLHFVNKKVKQRAKSITSITFECLVSNPVSVTKKLFLSLNLNYSVQTKNWIAEHTHTDSKIHSSHNKSLNQETGTHNQTYGTFHIRKTSSKEVANAWRKSLSTDLIQRVDEVCVGTHDAIASSVSGNENSVCR